MTDKIKGTKVYRFTLQGFDTLNTVLKNLYYIIGGLAVVGISVWGFYTARSHIAEVAGSLALILASAFAFVEGAKLLAKILLKKDDKVK